jgi:DNA-binding LytR/AlgR family response regulator
MPPQAELRGLRVLLVEDNYLVAEHLRGVLSDHGCEVVGPAPRVESGLDLLRDDGKLDGAVLDINLNGEFCFPIAKALETLSVPFLFLTGYDDRAIIPSEFQAVPFLGKPVDEAELVAVANRVFHA